MVLLQFQQPSHKTAVRMPVALAQVVTGVNVRPTEEIGLADKPALSPDPRHSTSDMVRLKRHFCLACFLAILVANEIVTEVLHRY